MHWTEPFRSPAALALGGALVHFVWQGALVALLYGAASFVLRGRSARARYQAACAALALLALAPPATCVFLYTADGAAVAPGFAAAAEADAESWLPAAVAAWLAGVLVLTVRFAGGWARARRLARVQVRPLPAGLEEPFGALARRLGVRAGVRFLESTLARTPLVIGWLRPAVLVPAAAVAGLSRAELEAVIAHELAHVRRRDYLVNLAQSVVEVVLFYHPAVWWISRRIRVERELCCDDLAVEACGEPLTYARALAGLESLRSGFATPALAATDGPLLQRIRRVVGVSPPPSRLRGGWLGGVVSSLAALLLAAGAGLSISACHGVHHAEDREIEITESDRGGSVDRMTLTETVNGVERRWVTEPGPDGEPVHTYTVNGEPRPIDAEIEAWKERLLEKSPDPPSPPERPGSFEREVEVIRTKD